MSTHLDEKQIRLCVRALVEERGRLAAAKFLGLSPPTVLALASGARVQMGTFAAAAYALGLTTTSTAA